MSRYFNDELYHSWGNSEEAKEREREYNAWYYRTHKDKFRKVKAKYYDSQRSRDKARDYQEQMEEKANEMVSPNLVDTFKNTEEIFQLNKKKKDAYKKASSDSEEARNTQKEILKDKKKLSTKVQYQAAKGKQFVEMMFESRYSGKY